METQETQNGSLNSRAPTPEPNTASAFSPSNPPVYSEPAKESCTWYPGPPPEPYSLAEPPQFAAAPSAPQLSPPPVAQAVTGVASVPPQMVYYVATPFAHQQYPHQQPQQVVWVSALQPQPVRPHNVQSFVGHVVFACVVTWFCNFAFGLIALVLAVTASHSSVSKPNQARKLGRASVGLSVSGIITGIVVVIVVAILFDVECSHYRYQGYCYTYKTYVGSRGPCDSGVKSSDGYCFSTQCGHHVYNGNCYKYKTYVGSLGSCNRYGAVKSSSGYCYSDSCNDYVIGDSCYKYKQRAGDHASCGSSTAVESGDYCYHMSCPADTYAYGSFCYNYKKYIGGSSSCNVGVKSYDGYCYFDSCKYLVRGSCYRYKKYVGSRTCFGVKYGSYCYYDYCPDEEYDRNCYTHKRSVASWGYCSGVKVENYCYSSPYSAGY